MDCQDECVSREIRRLLQRKSHFKIEPWVGLSALRLESLKGYSIPLIKGLLKARIYPIISENNETETNRWFRGGKNHAQKPKIALLRRPEVKLSKK